MRVLIGFESSGVVREAFRRRGFDAWSCDLQPADDRSEHHFQCDIWEVAHQSWALGIFHPPCTYLTLSAAWAFTDGPYHQTVKAGTLVGAARRTARKEALSVVRRLLKLPYPVVIENPRGFISTMIKRPAQVIQPNQFGDDASKATCLWHGEYCELPLLVSTKQIAPRIVNGRPRWANQTDSGQNRLSPSDDRWKLRSKTFAGIAEALADQIGGWLLQPKLKQDLFA